MLNIARSTVVVVILLLTASSRAEAVDLLTPILCEELHRIQVNAEGGDSERQVALSKIYHGGGCGIAKDDVTAGKWARLSATQGNAEGEAMLALLLNRGWGVTRDDAEAIKWARRSAEQGNIPGQDYLALMLHHGWGAPKNEVEAVKWARLSADQGDAQGEDLMALMLAEEPAAPKDDVEAVKWARLSAQQGHEGGEFILGGMYLMGRGGLTKDYIEADKWYILCGRTNRASVATNRKRVESFMSVKDIAEANRRADAWRPKDPTK
jgi:hypothetical protein